MEIIILPIVIINALLHILCSFKFAIISYPHYESNYNSSIYGQAGENKSSEIKKKKKKKQFYSSNAYKDVVQPVRARGWIEFSRGDLSSSFILPLGVRSITFRRLK